MSWKDKLFGRKLSVVGKRRHKKTDGTTITVTRDIRYTVKDGRSAIHMYGLDDGKHYSRQYLQDRCAI